MKKGKTYIRLETGKEYKLYYIKHPTLSFPGRISLVDEDGNKVHETVKSFLAKYV